ncbi:Hypothetical predicted protein, partial [Paramuricea clavata]
MRVNLAAQVLSASVAAVLKEFGPPEAAGTAKFALMMDKFFDCLNVRSDSEHKIKRKPYLAPYTSLVDERFSWLENEFLSYFKAWKKSTTDRVGNFTPNARSKMFISWQTYEELAYKQLNDTKEIDQIFLHNLIELSKLRRLYLHRYDKIVLRQGRHLVLMDLIKTLGHSRKDPYHPHGGNRKNFLCGGKYINTIIQKATTYTSTNQHISTLCCYYLKLHLSHYSGSTINAC